jgi:WD40 repeat protein
MSPVDTRVNPYPGLAPFQEHDAARFFGRDREIDEVLDRLATRHLLAVIGVSGCGKSSLVRAGVIPVLRMGAAGNLSARFRICAMRPGNAPLRALTAALGAHADWPTASFDLVDHARNTLQAGESLLLVVDQFEELFRYRAETMAQDGGNAASLFANLLLNAVDQREVPVYVLLTMRTDFLGECAQFRGLPEALNECYYLVPRLTRLGQQEAIERPLEKQGTAVHPALVQRLLNDSAEDPDQLPVLQHLLKRLWENWRARGADEPIGNQDYESAGGWNEALDQDAEMVLGRFPAESESIRRVFQWITDRGTGEKPVRRARLFSECVGVSGLERERLGEILGAFQERGLLKPPDTSADWLVDLPHESLMWQWSRLKTWIVEEAEQSAQVRFLLQSARQQMALTGLALESGLKLRSEWRKQPLAVRRYVEAEEREQIEAWIDRSEVLEKTKLASAEARELSAWSAATLRENPERSLILGLYAWGKQRAMVGGLEQFLHDAVLQSASRFTLRGHQGGVNCIAWSPDGSRLATASDDHTAKVWEVTSGREFLTLRGHRGIVWSIAWSPHGGRLATASDDHTARVWEAVSGRELMTLRGHQFYVWSIAWSPDGSMVATASLDRTAKVWEVASGRELQTLRGHRGGVWSLTWSPDGSMVATASDDRTAKVWEVPSGRELRILHGHEDAVRSIAWSPDASRLATASDDKTAKVWEAASGRELLTLRGHEDALRSIAWSPDGRRLATASFDHTAVIWDATSDRVRTLRGHQGCVWSVVWSPDGNRLATASFDNTGKVWEGGSDRELLALRGHQGSVKSIGWSPDGGRLATASADGTAKVWDAAGGGELLALGDHQNDVLSIAWSPDGARAGHGQFRPHGQGVGGSQWPRATHVWRPSRPCPEHRVVAGWEQAGHRERRRHGEGVGGGQWPGVAYPARPSRRCPKRRVVAGWEQASDGERRRHGAGLCHRPGATPAAGPLAHHARPDG